MMDASPLTVLIIDDAPEDRLTVRRLLARAAPGGYRFLEADRSNQALAVIQATPPDCMLLDQHLPDMDGLKLLAALRAFTDTPVILLTGIGNEALAVTALQQGAQDYLTKDTLTPERLHLTIQRAITTVQLVRERDQAQALLTTVIDTLPVGVAALDSELHILQLNPALAGLLGRSAAALRGKPLLEYWPAYATTLAPACAQVLLTGQPAGPLDLIIAGPQLGGVRQTWQAYLHPLALPNSETSGLCMVVQEVTALAQANATLQASEQRLRLALDAAELIAWEWDIAAGRFTYTTHETLPINLPPGQLTCTIDEMIGAVYPPDRPALAQVVETALAQGGAYTFQLRMLGPTGQLHWIDFRGLVQHDVAGQPVQGIGIMRNITATKRREAAQTLHATISQALRADLDVAATLNALARLPLPDMADICAIYLRDDDGQAHLSTAWAGNPAAPLPLPDILSGIAPAGEPDLVAAVLHSGTTRLVAGIPPGREYASGLIALRSALLVPLAAHEQILGVLLLGLTSDTRRYEADDLALAVKLARRGAEALIQARLQAKAQAAQQAAAEALARLDALVTSAPNGIAYLDRELRYQLINPALAALNGRTLAEHLGHTPAEVLGRISSRVIPIIQQVLATGEPVRDLELQAQPTPDDAADYHWLSSFFPVPAPDGSVAGVGVTVTDMTRHKQTEAALRESEARFRTVAELSPDGILVHQDGHLVYANPAAARIYGVDDPARLIGLGPADIVAPEHQELARLSIQQSLAGEMVLGDEIDFVRPDGSRVTVDASSARISWDGAPAVEVLWHDVSERKRVEAALRVSEAQVRSALVAEQTARLFAEAASARTTRLQAITADLAGALTQDAVLTVMTGHVLAATDAIVAVVSTLNPDSHKLTLIGWTGEGSESPTAFQHTLHSVPPSLISAVGTGEAIWLSSHADAEARFPGVGALLTKTGYAAHVTLPLISADKVMGALSFGYPVSKTFPPEEKAFLLAIAQQCAQALERARLYAEVLESQERLRHLSERLVAVQEEERHHLARELHDEIGQSLTGLSLLLTIGPTLPPEALHAQLAEAQHQVAGLIAQVRQRSMDLRPAMLDDLGLHPALEWYFTRYQEQTSITLDVELQGLAGRFAPLVELTAYRIVQEALTNIARHARVDHATILVWAANARLLIEVSDTGQGFDLETVRHAYASHGLVGMRERATLLGGELLIESAPGAGTHLFAVLPLLPSATTEEVV